MDGGNGIGWTGGVGGICRIDGIHFPDGCDGEVG